MASCARRETARKSYVARVTDPTHHVHGGLSADVPRAWPCDPGSAGLEELDGNSCKLPGLSALVRLSERVFAFGFRPQPLSKTRLIPRRKMTQRMPRPWPTNVMSFR